MTAIQLTQSILLGAVEGVSEFLPISSTAHLTLAAELLRLEQTEFLKSFEVVIQVGAILAVIALYWRRLLRDWATFKRVAVAFIPTGLLGLVFYRLIKRYLLGNVIVVLSALLVGGALLIFFERWLARRRAVAPAGTAAVGLAVPTDIGRLRYSQCLAIGAFQSLAMVPGVSRAAATVVGGLLLGLERRTIVEFSFLLAVPTMLAAAGLDLSKSVQDFQADQFGFLAVGFAVSFLTALVTVRWLIGYVSRHDFRAFGWYRIVLALVMAVVLLPHV